MRAAGESDIDYIQRLWIYGRRFSRSVSTLRGYSTGWRAFIAFLGKVYGIYSDKGAFELLPRGRRQRAARLPSHTL